MTFQSFPIVKMVVDAATDRFSPQFRLNEENLQILREYCEECFDPMIRDLEVESMSCDVDEETMDISVSFTMFSLQSGDPNSPVQKLMHVAKSVEIKNPDGENVEVVFTFPPLWDAA